MGVAHVGPTGGGNPLWMCADCERGGAAMDSSHLCGCGMHFKHAEPGAFMCLRLPDDIPENAWVIDVFAHCGYDARAQNRKGVVGIVNVEFYRQKHQQHEAKLLEKSQSKAKP